MLTVDEIFMREAFKQAQLAQQADEVPVGAVVTYNNQMIAKAHNQVELLKDPTAHAEMIAITQATNTLKVKWLESCTIYITLEPCSMCAGALVLARVGRVCFGANDPKAGAGGSVLDILEYPKLNHQPQVFRGILAEECGAILSEYFQAKRNIGKK